MNSGTLDDRYLRWLYGQVADVKTRKSSSTHWYLLRELYKTEFIFFVPNDANRAMDGTQLRYDWMHESNTRPDNNWIDLGCSFLEMLIALSIRASFQSDQTQEYWFWHLLDNANLTQFNDNNECDEEVHMIIDRINDRTYKANGEGGLFPLRDPDSDQRKVEIWYQLCEYLLQD